MRVVGKEKVEKENCTISNTIAKMGVRQDG